MKRKFIVAAMAAAVLASCSEKVGYELETERKSVDLNVEISCTETKAVGVTEDVEKKVNSVQVFVFGEGNRLEASKRETGTSSVKMGIFSGRKTVVAVVNAPELSGISDLNALSTKVSDFKENSIGNFVMVGKETYDVGVEGATIPVKVKRLVSKVSLTKVVNKLSGTYGEMSFKVTRAFLVNVAGSYAYYSESSTVPEPTTWYHKRDYMEADGIRELAYGDYSSATVDASAIHHFYCYPNSTAKDSSVKGDWTSRYTRLVVEVELDEKPYYYPVNLKNMVSNYIYEVELTVTRPGSLDPDLPYNEESATVNVSVLPWEKTIKVEDKI